MIIKQPNRFGILTVNNLKDFERKYNLSLPESYMEFLLQNNGGDPYPKNSIDFEENGKISSSDVNYFYGIHNGENWARLEWKVKCFKDRIIEEGLSIACDSLGNQFVLITRGNKKGQIYFWDHERESDKPNFQNMNYVANDFEEFTRKLYEYIDPNESEIDRIIRKNDLIELEKLLKSGYDIEKVDNYTHTLLEKAAIENRSEIIQILFDSGAKLGKALKYAKENYQYFKDYKVSVDLLEKLYIQRGG